MDFTNLTMRIKEEKIMFVTSDLDCAHEVFIVFGGYT